MKRLIIIGLLILSFKAGFAQVSAQVRGDSALLADAGVFYVEASQLPSLSRSQSFPFDSIIFKDVRFDTTNVGAANNIDFMSKKNKFVFIKFQNGLSGFLNAKLNTRPAVKQDSLSAKHDSALIRHDSLSENLICYIRKFRVTEVDTNYEYKVKGQKEVRIRSAIDAFYQKEGRLYPAFKSDTSFSRTFPEKKGYLIMDSMILALCEKARKIEKQKILGRKSFSEGFVDSTYSSRFNIPILTTSALKKGVYTNVKEFQTNNPSIDEYEWMPDHDVNILYTRERSGNWVVTRREVFGLCDGNNIWLKVKNSFFPAFQRGHAFLVFAPLYLQRKQTEGRSNVIVQKQQAYSYGDMHLIAHNDKSVYQLDMDTGEFY